MTPYDHFSRDDLTLRDELALDRTRLANERTLLAYLRTAFMLVVAGATVLKVFGDTALMIGSGWLLVVIGAVITARGAQRFLHVRRALSRLDRSE